jgi:two-component system, NtrC family, nitrogen regulation sensor histidine kinase NtrY
VGDIVMLKRFRAQIILRVMILSLTLLLIFGVLIPLHIYATVVIACLAVIYQVITLIRCVETTNRQLSRFLLAAQYEDSAHVFTGAEMGPSFARLAGALNGVVKNISRTRSEKEEQYRYLQTVVHHVGIGLIVFTEDGTIDLINTAARHLLNVGGIGNIRSLESVSPVLVEKLFSAKHGDKGLIKIDNRADSRIGTEMELAINAVEFIRMDRKFTLVSLQDIQGELQEKELEAWQTLIRVLTHEIMNSMTPITSMTATVLDMIEQLESVGENVRIDGTEQVLPREMLIDIGDALRTIHKRSSSLAQFVDAYRNLTLIPKPKFKIFLIRELFERIESLMRNQLNERGVDFSFAVEPRTLELTADAGQIEQVLINLIINALDATENCERPTIKISSGLDDNGRIYMWVVDNGTGIVKEALGKVFIPFFTTKKKGSGIGLSISRQILKLHRGTITVQSIPNKQTTFILIF